MPKAIKELVAFSKPSAVLLLSNWVFFEVFWDCSSNLRSCSIDFYCAVSNLDESKPSSINNESITVAIIYILICSQYMHYADLRHEFQEESINLLLHKPYQVRAKLLILTIRQLLSFAGRLDTQ